MKVYLVWMWRVKWEDDVLFKVFSKEVDAEECAAGERELDAKEGVHRYSYHVTEEEVE